MTSIRQRLSAVAVAAGLTLAAACGGSSDAGSDSGNDAAADSAAVAKAKADYDTYANGTPKIGITEPLNAPVPTGKTIDFIACAPAACLEVPKRMQEAAEKIGWKVNIITAQADPGSVQAAFAQAVRNKPDVVAYGGFELVTIQRQVKELKDLGIPVIATAITEEIGEETGILANVRGPNYQKLVGKALAAAVIKETKGKANIGFVDISYFPIYSFVKEGFDEAMDEYCAECSIKVTDMPVTSIGKDASTRLLNFLRANPKINSLVAVADGVNLGLPAAMKSAGIADKVKLFSGTPTAANLPFVASGAESAVVPIPYDEAGWIMVDASIRALLGMSLEESSSAEAMPTVLLTKDNLTSTTEIETLVPDHQEIFLKLWGK